MGRYRRLLPEAPKSFPGWRRTRLCRWPLANERATVEHDNRFAEDQIEAPRNGALLVDRAEKLDQRLPGREIRIAGQKAAHRPDIRAGLICRSASWNEMPAASASLLFGRGVVPNGGVGAPPAMERLGVAVAAGFRYFCQ